MKQQQHFKEQIRPLRSILVIFSIVLILLSVVAAVVLMNPDLISTKPSEVEVAGPELVPEAEDEWNKIENGIHVRTGFKDATGLMEVVNNCTVCHSSELVIQNRMSRERWVESIRWMQETQNLWDLGENEEIILNYLVTNYPVINTGRRAPLPEVEWYPLNQ